MRIRSLDFENVAGLTDGRIELPASELLAIAGPNGSGKSRLLLCLIAPWLQDLPPAGDPDRVTTVAVRIEFDHFERSELRALSDEYDWGPIEVPDSALLTVRREPRAGIIFRTEPELNVLRSALSNLAFLARVPSLDVVYLPAERRLMSVSTALIDLDALSPAMGVESTRNARAMALRNAGQLDESEFQNYARALSVAAYLPDSDDAGRPRSYEDPIEAWNNFKGAADQLLEPKQLLPLTRSRPGELSIQLPEGSTHSVEALSSGERQALVILGRLYRAGQSRTVTIIDEPDLHLHPQLSAQLLASIRLLQPSQLIFATHSPFILDTVPTDAIIELRRGAPPAHLQSESDRIAAYRAAGFRASELTQADLLIVTESDFDGAVLSSIEPSLARAAIRGVGGRSRVIQLVHDLARYQLEILGVVDNDVLADNIPVEMADIVQSWPLSDIEAVLLSDPHVLEVMIGRGFIRDEYALVSTLEAEIRSLAGGVRNNAIAEVTQRLLRQRFPDPYPSPRGDRPVERLEEEWLRNRSQVFTADDFRSVLLSATELIDQAADVFAFVRGKWILGDFVRFTHFRDGASVLLATARALDRPPDRMLPFLNAARTRLGLGLL